MSRNAIISFALVAICLGCQPAKKSTTPSAGPRVRATVVTIRTSVKPENQAWEHALVIAGSRARYTGELDTWHLYDVKAKTVTFVDDVAKTVRTEPFDLVLRRRKLAEAGPLPSHFPSAKFVRTDEKRTIQGAAASRAFIRAGEYQRELWFAPHPSIPEGLFAMMHASETPSSPLAPMMQDVDEALASERGFPLFDRTTVPLGKKSIVVDRMVTSIVSRDVPQALFEIPRDYLDLSASRKKKP